MGSNQVSCILGHPFDVRTWQISNFKSRDERYYMRDDLTHLMSKHVGPRTANMTRRNTSTSSPQQQAEGANNRRHLHSYDTCTVA
jgi:hypothetical protein